MCSCPPAPCKRLMPKRPMSTARRCRVARMINRALQWQDRRLSPDPALLTGVSRCPAPRGPVCESSPGSRATALLPLGLQPDHLREQAATGYQQTHQPAQGLGDLSEKQRVELDDEEGRAIAHQHAETPANP